MRATKRDARLLVTRVLNGFISAGVLPAGSTAIFHEGSSTYGYAWRLFFDDPSRGQIDVLGDGGRLGVTLAETIATLNGIERGLMAVSKRGGVTL